MLYTKTVLFFNRGKTYIRRVLHKYILELFINTLHIDKKKNNFFLNYNVTH